MNVSEIVILLLVYSGLLTFFLSPYREIEQIKESNDQVFFRSVFKNNLENIVFQKKALFALMLLGIALISIQLLFDSAEWHYNAHSGYPRSEEHTSELQSRGHLVCRLLLEKKKPLSLHINQHE